MKWGGVNPSKTESYKTSEELAKDVMQKSIVKLNALSNESYVDKVMDAKAVMELISNPKTNSIAAGGDTPLEDVFYLHEGLFNNQYADIMADYMDVERVTSNFTVDIHSGLNGDYFINNTDLTDFYSDLASSVGVEINQSNNEILVLCDLNLKSIDTDNGNCVIAAGISIAIELPVPLTPAGPYRAAQQLGPCPTGNPGLDAADFIQAYANNSLSHSCNNGYYTLSLGGWVSYDWTFASSYNDWMNNAYVNVWKGDNNVCLGNTNAEWYSLYSQMDALRGNGLSYMQSIMPNTTGLTFLLTNYHSSPAGGAGFGNIPANSGFYHGGEFSYGQIICL